MSDRESTAKYASSGEYADTCSRCMKETGLDYLFSETQFEEGDEDYEDEVDEQDEGEDQ